jgi:hypothetical protein
MSIYISTTMLESVCQLLCHVQYLFICEMLWVPPCIEINVTNCYVYLLYVGCHMPNIVCLLIYLKVPYADSYMPSIICQLLYVKYHMLATMSLHSYQLTCQSQYQLLCAIYKCYMSNAICSISQVLYAPCQIPYANYYIPTFICWPLSAKCSLWVAKLCLFVKS